MKKLLIVSTLLLMLPMVAAADMEDALGSLLSDILDPDAARRKRYARRYEIMMVRDAKQGRVTPLISVESPVMPVAAVAPMMPVAPVAASDAADNAEKVSVRVESLAYDEKSGNGILKVAIVGGTFKEVNNYLHANIGKLIRNDAPGEDAPKVPPDAGIAIESLTIDENDVCEIKFTAR